MRNKQRKYGVNLLIGVDLFLKSSGQQISYSLVKKGGRFSKLKGDWYEVVLGFIFDTDTGWVNGR